MSTGWRAGLRACIACIALWMVGVHATTTCTYFGPTGGQGRLRGAAALEKEVASWAGAPWARPEVICVFFSHLEPQDSEPWRVPCEADGYAGPVPMLVHTGFRLDQEVSPAPTDTVPGPYTRYARLVFAVQNSGGGNAGPASGTLVGKPESIAQCETFPSVIGFFNGVWTTEQEAKANQIELEKEFGAARNQTPLEYKLFYNQTGCSRKNGKLGCLEDLFEVFEQRNRELGGGFSDRYEFLWELVSGTDDEPRSHIGSILQSLGKQGKAFVAIVRSYATKFASTVLAGTAAAIANPPTAEDESTHIAQLLGIDDQKMGAVLVAHSQGNLFANTAYDAILKQRPDAMVRLVHVAPASPTLRGDYVLADTDIVINGLRILYMGGVPPNNINVPTDKADISTHAFINTYMDPSRGARARLIGLIAPALDAL